MVTISGAHLNTISSRMGMALKILCDWCNTSGLSVNPSETELVLFSRRNKIPSFNLPNLNETELTLTDKAKYLCNILYRKLSWKPNIHARTSKAISDIYICRKVIGGTWRAKPKKKT